MRIYICSVCGYDYDEAAGDPQHGIAPGTRWEDIPEDWVCPICGADKSMFTLQGGTEDQAPAPKAAASAASRQAGQAQDQAKRLAIMASNLARGAGKQYREAASASLTQLAAYYEGQSRPDGGMQDIRQRLSQDLDSAYPEAFDAARAAADRGALRALTWGEKVSKIQSALLARYEKDGEAAFSEGSFYVCDACGFIFFGEDAPDLCPVCKVPKFKFNQIQKGA